MLDGRLRRARKIMTNNELCSQTLVEINSLRRRIENKYEANRLRNDSEPLSIAIHNILAYIIKSTANNPVTLDDCALTARKLMECLVIIEYIINSNKNLNDWIMQKIIDEKELLNCIIESAENEEDKVPFRKRSEKLLVQETKKRTSIETMSKQGQYKIEYANFNKQYSKFVHVSSLSVNMLLDEDMSMAFCYAFISRSKYYLEQVCSILENIDMDQRSIK